MWTKKSHFFGASPSKLVYIGAKGAFTKILGSVSQQWTSQTSTKGGPFGSAVLEFLRGGGGGGGVVRPPISAPDYLH